MFKPDPDFLDQFSGKISDAVSRAFAEVNATKPSEPLLVSPDRLAELLSVSRSTVDRMASEGKICPVKIGSNVRYSPTEVVGALLEAR